jgi:hypothetical protein
MHNWYQEYDVIFAGTYIVIPVLSIVYIYSPNEPMPNISWSLSPTGFVNGYYWDFLSKTSRDPHITPRGLSGYTTRTYKPCASNVCNPEFRSNMADVPK